MGEREVMVHDAQPENKVKSLAREGQNPHGLDGRVNAVAGDQGRSSKAKGDETMSKSSAAAGVSDEKNKGGPTGARADFEKLDPPRQVEPSAKWKRKKKAKTKRNRTAKRSQNREREFFKKRFSKIR